MARQILTARKVREGVIATPKMIFVTVFGATEIKCPTLAEEYLDMREAVQSGVIHPSDWERYQTELDQYQSSSLLSLTLFGGFSESELPTEDEEIEGLALQRHFGNIGADSGRVLEMGVGQSGSQRQAVIRQAVQVG